LQSSTESTSSLENQSPSTGGLVSKVVLVPAPSSDAKTQAPTSFVNYITVLGGLKAGFYLRVI